MVERGGTGNNNPLGISNSSYDALLKQAKGLETKAATLDPAFKAFPGHAKDRIQYASRYINTAKNQLSEAVGKSQRDLNHQIRSEIGQDGGETYFESYKGIVKCGLVNYITERTEYHHWTVGSYAGHGILGSTELTYTLGSTRFNESNIIQDLDEDFTATTYQDATTTAQGWGQGSLVFTTPGSTLGVFSSWKSGNFQQTSFDKIRIDPTFGSYNPAVTFEASFNGGSNYTSVEPLITTTIPAGQTGSDFRLRITDTTGSVVLTNCYITTYGVGFA